MKIFGFTTKNEKSFVHITCNIILALTLLVIFSMSIFSPLSSEVNTQKTSAIYYGDRKSNNVSLMVNVYWGEEYLDKMLEIFDKYNIKTTFFVGGCWVAKNNDYLQKIVNKGHEIGNHGYFHKDHKKLSLNSNIDEIYMTEQLIFSLCGTKTRLFAPPSGSYNDNVLKVCQSLEYKTIMWSRDTIDWRDKDEDLIFKRATEKTVGGDLILMHPTSCTSSVLEKIILALQKKGLNLTTVSETIGIL